MKKRTVSKVARFAIATAFAFSATSVAYADTDLSFGDGEAEAALLLPAVQAAREAARRVVATSAGHQGEINSWSLTGTVDVDLRTDSDRGSSDYGIRLEDVLVSS